MNAVKREAGGNGKRLPIKGDKKNISELTAIARIKTGEYPRNRLPDEYKQIFFEDMAESMEHLLDDGIPHTGFETNLKNLCNQMIDNFYKELQQIEKKIEEFLKTNQWMEKLAGEDRPHPNFETNLKKFCVQLGEKFFEGNQPPLVTEKQIEEFITKSALSKKNTSKIKNILSESEKQLRQSPREMTWLEHLKRVGKRSHEKRQEEIRKMSTIHYARWFIVDENNLPGLDGAHLVFTSNYDGKLDDYLEDFANVDEGPLNLVFGHCMGWPGARPAEGFIKYVKEHQYPALIFYANYPLATVGEVRRALDWKNKTQRFIEKDVSRLLNGTSTKSASILRKILSHYLNELAKPTSKSEDEPKNHVGDLRIIKKPRNNGDNPANRHLGEAKCLL